MILRVRDVRKEYQGRPAVVGVSFQLEVGKITGLLGPNGAGKTTTINMILGVLKPTSGTIEISGLDVERRRAEVSGADVDHPVGDAQTLEELLLEGADGVVLGR